MWLLQRGRWFHTVIPGPSFFHLWLCLPRGLRVFSGWQKGKGMVKVKAQPFLTALRLTAHVPLAPPIPIHQWSLVVTWPYLDAKDIGKCSLCSGSGFTATSVLGKCMFWQINLFCYIFPLKLLTCSHRQSHLSHEAFSNPSSHWGSLLLYT